MLISLVGLSGSGKSYIARLLCSYNKHILHLDIDKIAHEALKEEQIKNKLVSIFGSSILEENEISRKKIGNIVFTSKEAMELYNQLIWQYEEKKIDEFIALHPHNIIILDWLLLPMTKYFMQSDLRVLITAPLDMRMSRAMERDNITAEKFLKRESAAPKLNEFDYEYIINNIDLKTTKKEVGKIYGKSLIHR